MGILFGDWWQQLDVADRVMFARIALTAYVVFGVIESLALGNGGMGAARGLLLFVVVNPIVAIMFSRIALAIITRLAGGAIHGLAGSGGDPYQVGFSAQEAMVIRGDWQGAVASYRGILSENPGNHEAKLRLARLLVRHGATESVAEQYYLEIRRDDRDGKHEGAVSNALIDLYRASGRREELRRELIRAAQKHDGTPRGDGARRELREMTVSEGTDAT